MRTKSNGRKRTQRLRSLGPLFFCLQSPHILQDGCQETLERRRGNLTDQA